jgi:hypothetical protein
MRTMKAFLGNRKIEEKVGLNRLETVTGGTKGEVTRVQGHR